MLSRLHLGTLLTFLATLCHLSLQAEGERETYIPYDVADAVRELKQILSPEAAAILVNPPDPFATDTKAHLASPKPIAMQVRNLWRLWHHDNRLTQYFLVKGIYNGDLRWGIIHDAFVAEQKGKRFNLRQSLRRTLAMYAAEVNVPHIAEEMPERFKSQNPEHTHYLQRDDLTVILVFSTKAGDPVCTFIHGSGWQVADDVIKVKAKTKEAISVSHFSPPSSNPPEESDPFAPRK